LQPTVGVMITSADEEHVTYKELVPLLVDMTVLDALIAATRKYAQVRRHGLFLSPW